MIQDLGGSVVEKLNASVDCCISSQGIYNHVLGCTRVVLEKRVTLPAESTEASVYIGKKVTSLCKPRADNSVYACSDYLFSTEVTHLGELKCLYEEDLAQVEG